MKSFITSIALLLTLSVSSQPDIAKKLAARYEIKKGFSTTVTILIDVPGIVAPPKTIDIYAENGKAPKINGKGLILLPKKGFVEQFSELLTIPVHWIFIEEKAGYQYYKLVSLDAKSDWVTADLKILSKDPRIDEINLTTRESGVFQINHFYAKGKYPERTEINFTTDKFSIPLKFLGKADDKGAIEKDGKVQGKITLTFSKFVTF